MQQALPVIYCPNLKCRTANPEGATVCQQCGARLPNRYLWILGLEPDADRVQDSLVDRYRFRGPQVVVDMQPGIPLASSFDITDDILPYLKLFPWRLHLPQVYSLLPADLLAASSAPIVLLEGAPLAFKDFSPSDSLSATEIHKIAIAEDFTEAWKQAPALRQVNWLWQMAQLWLPLQREGVTSSLINPQILRVEGPLLRLLSLDYSPDPSIPLSELGRFWAKWCLPAVGRWQSKFTDLCDRLMDGQIATIDPLLDDLEAWLAAVRATSSIRVDIATRTDSGPTREHNEDACYPPHGTVTQNGVDGLMIVCDGVGGHAGGEVASGIAIKALTESLRQTPLQTLPPEEVMLELESAVGVANDQIAQENDQGNRHDRDRMGTTVVMALTQNQDLYISNLGDSRAYLITENACYQVTTDDDIATREVRLGYLPHREAQRQPGAGSLIQALGMVPASMLRPATTRFLLDSDCLFLLCSDGLSDFERVESLWREELLPLLQGQIDLAETTKRLIAAANRLNGHDNVTVALVHCQKKDINSEQTVVEGSQTPLPLKTQLRDRPLSDDEKPRRSPALMPWLLGLLVLFCVGAAFAFFFRKTAQVPALTASSPELSPSQTKTIAPSGTGASTSPSTLPPVSSAVLETGTYWMIQPAQASASVKPAPANLGLRTITALRTRPFGILKEGMVLKVLGMQQNEKDPAQWLHVQLCHVPVAKAVSTPANAPSPNNSSQAASPLSTEKDTLTLKPSDKGYVEAAPFLKNVLRVNEGTLDTLKLEGCAAASASPSP
jgi:serine/threonine protein phosphatase PrpC